MFFKTLDLTTALRPELLPDETLLFVQDAIGLYEGKFKIPSHQGGHGYLTSHRICYVDNAEPRANSLAIDLKDVDRYEFYAGFLKSSAKITLYPKPPKRPLSYLQSPRTGHASLSSHSAANSGRSSPFQGAASPQVIESTWICPICSFSNPVPANFDPSTANESTPVPPCLACGIKPPMVHVLKAAIAARTTRRPVGGGEETADESLARSLGQSSLIERVGSNNNNNTAPETTPQATAKVPQSSFQCPRCTFLNHPSLLTCELCGASLLSTDPLTNPYNQHPQRSESPGPSLQNAQVTTHPNPESIKLSFRNGGEKIFHERLKNAMVQRRWLLSNAPPVPRPQDLLSGPNNNNNSDDITSSSPSSSLRGSGIAGLERRGHELRKNNQIVIGNAFEDLEALMASAKEIIALAESFASRSSASDATTTPEASAILSESAAVLGITTTRDMLAGGGGGSLSSSDTLYISELARNLAEYLTDDRRGVLKRAGGVMSLVDLWAVFNRSRNGVELVSPADFERAARQWEILGLPVRLRKFRNGLLVVQRHDWTDERIVAQLLAWLRGMHGPFFGEDWGAWDVVRFGRGVTALEAASRFGWSVGVATEELEMAEERGAVCREEGIEGVRFWENWLIS
ncbi:hypothetical protein MMC25_007226 [Agyrium rufum]|nr:hypothetical protein [Agyrium rufum]